jgi:threonine/homoserine/homoserine lactone efflux protein
MAELWNAIAGGAFAGLVIAVMIGPIFFALLQVSIEKGFLIGLVFALGIVSSDAFFFTLAYLGLSQFGTSKLVHEIMGVVGGGFLIGFGFYLGLKKIKEMKPSGDIIYRTSLVKSYFKGFFLNSLNPSAFLYWVMVVTAVHAQYEGNANKIFAFFMATMIIVFSTDTLKAFLATKLKNVITATFMLWLNRVSGIVLIGAGVKLIWDAGKVFLAG